jgi:uncharacterized membrane protein
VLNAYNLLKLLHILSVIAWVGGVLALSVVTWRLRKERNREVLSALVRQAAIFAQRVVGPASGVVLLSGLAMVGMAKIGFGTLWVVWGMAGVLFHFVMGATVIRKRATALAQIAEGSDRDDAALPAASRRLWTAQLIYLAVLASVVAAMVLKPTLSR